MTKRSKKTIIANYDSSKKKNLDTVNTGIKRRTNIVVIYDSKTRKCKYV